MAIENFIPEVWSAELETSYEAAQIVIPTSTASYDGEASKGNTVHITGAVTPTIVDYKAAGRKISAEALADTNTDLLIDQERAFALDIDDIDKRQAAGSLDAYTVAAGEAMAAEAETFVLEAFLADGTPINVVGSSPVTIDSASKALAALRAIRTQLTKHKVPSASRYVAVNPAFADLVLEKLSEVSNAGDTPLRNGVIGQIYGLTVLEDPHFTEESKPVAVGYHSRAWAFVSQIDQMEAIRNPEKFGDIARGLTVYGTKVTNPLGVVSFVSGGVEAPAEESDGE